MLEATFRKKLIDQILREYPGCVVLKTDPSDILSIPDRIILYKDRWAALETKRYTNSSEQPNQDYWVNRLDKMSFAAFVNPSNFKEVLYDMEQSLRF